MDAAKDLGWFATAVGSQVAQHFTGVDPVAAGEHAEKKKAERQGRRSLPQDAFSVYEGRKSAMADLKKAIAEFVAKSGSRVLFLVDELDRCRPDYAITYLETVKHIFDVEGATFILAADRDQLANSAKTAFGSELDFDEYYRKFVHREVTLPPISEWGYRKLTETYVTHYLERDGLRDCFMEVERNNIRRINELIEALRLTPRQIQEVFRILGHVLETSKTNKGQLLWCLGVGSIAMAAFRVGCPRVFSLLGSGDFESKDAVGFLTDLNIKSGVYW